MGIDGSGCWAVTGSSLSLWMLHLLCRLLQKRICVRRHMPTPTFTHTQIAQFAFEVRAVVQYWPCFFSPLL